MLTQGEADFFIQMPKRFVPPIPNVAILPGADKSYELVSSDGKEGFLLDVWRGTLKISKVKYQNRVKKCIVLVRLDVDGAPHTNPDGNLMGGTHLHIYREGYDYKWAFPIDPSQFTNVHDIQGTFAEFCAFCNIEAVPPTQGELL